MGNLEGFTKTITNSAQLVNQYTGGNTVLNIIFVAVIIFVLYKISKRV